MASQESVKVVVRVRPMVGREQLRGSGKNRSRCAVVVEEDKNKVTVSDSLEDYQDQQDEAAQKEQKRRNVSCTYDMVFGPEASQERLFEDLVAPSVEAVTKGINCTVFAYGQTGTGKTFTILGPDQGAARKKTGAKKNKKIVNENDSDESEEGSTEGMIPRAVRKLFELLKEQAAETFPEDEDYEMEDEEPTTRDSKEKNENQVVSSTVYCSYLQVYNEQLFDLLQDQKRQFPLKIRQTKQGTNYVQGLAEIRVSCLDDVYQVLHRGSRSRIIRATEYNESSSRSHAILQLRVETEEIATGISESRVFRSAKFNFVDLAGSEKWDTNVDISDKRQKELTKINNSLSALGNVVQALCDKDRVHVPYRDSKLTHLLQDSLGGNTRTTVICTLSPAADSIDESISTLKFADRAKRVMLSVKVNEVVDDSVLLAHAQAEIARLKRLLRQKTTENKPSKAVLNEIQALRQENAELKHALLQMKEAMSSMQQSSSSFLPASNNNNNNNNEETDNVMDDDAKDKHDLLTAKPSERPESSASSLEDHLALDQVNADSQPETTLEHLERDASSLVLGDENQEKTKKENQNESQRQQQQQQQVPAPSDILKALRDELETGETSFGVWDDDQEKLLEEVEQQCFDELSYELEQLQTLRRERESLEEAMRLLKDGKKRTSSHKGLPSSLRSSPLLAQRPSKASATKEAKTDESSGRNTKAALSFSARDVGRGILLYQCRVDAWYKVDVLSYDSKSGMHRVKYREDGSEQWHQMEGRKYKLIEPSQSGKSAGMKTLLREARQTEHERSERAKIKQALKKGKHLDKFQAYGGLTSVLKDRPGNRKSKLSPSPPTTSLDILNHHSETEILERLEAEGLGYSNCDDNNNDTRLNNNNNINSERAAVL